MKFDKLLQELQGEIGDNKLFYKGRGQGSPNAEIAQQSIINAVYAFIRDNSNGSMKELWNELNIKDPTEMDIVVNGAYNGAIIKTEKGNTWIAKTVTNPKTGSTKVINITKR